jgi:hypothetical protein
VLTTSVPEGFRQPVASERRRVGSVVCRGRVLGRQRTERHVWEFGLGGLFDCDRETGPSSAPVRGRQGYFMCIQPPPAAIWRTVLSRMPSTAQSSHNFDAFVRVNDGVVDSQPHRRHTAWHRSHQVTPMSCNPRAKPALHEGQICHGRRQSPACWLDGAGPHCRSGAVHSKVPPASS